MPGECYKMKAMSGFGVLACPALVLWTEAVVVVVGGS